MNKKSITLITGNPNKVKECKAILEPEIQVIHKSIPYPELRHDTPEAIVKQAAQALAESLQEPVLVEDSGLFIDSLDGFPGTCTKYVTKRIGNKGILQLMKAYAKPEERVCWYISAVGYAEPGKEPLAFLGKEKGRIAFEEKGTGGWGQDPIFIPEGQTKTYAELKETNVTMPNPFRKKALEQFKQWYLNP